MSEYIDRNKVAELLCGMICGSERDLCVSACENCRQKWMVKLYEIPKTDVVPVVHAAWVEVCDEVHDVLEERESYLMVRGYRCSRCNRFEKKMEPYCNCGAKMDLDT